MPRPRVVRLGPERILVVTRSRSVGDRRWEKAVHLQRIEELEKQAEESAACIKKLSERLQKAESDLKSSPPLLDTADAATAVNRLLGIASPPMSDDVAGLLWAHALRRLGVLTPAEYVTLKKRILARALEPRGNEENESSK